MDVCARPSHVILTLTDFEKDPFSGDERMNAPEKTNLVQQCFIDQGEAVITISKFSEYEYRAVSFRVCVTFFFH